jgi:hypothetical protein
LIAAEARRAKLAPNPDTMDLYFQGTAATKHRPKIEARCAMVCGRLAEFAPLQLMGADDIELLKPPSARREECLRDIKFALNFLTG